MKATKILAIVMAAIMALAVFSLSAAADSLSLEDFAEPVTFGKQYDEKLPDNYNDNTYSFTLKGKSRVSIKLVSYAKQSIFSGTYVQVYDKSENKYEAAVKIEVGTKETDGLLKSVKSSTLFGGEELFSGTLTYALPSAGTYYVRFGTINSSDSGKDFNFTLKQTLITSAASDATPVMTVNLAKGAKLQFGTLLTNGKPTQAATWASSKADVASVDKSGNVTAKKKGQTTVTAKIGTSVLKFVVKVS